MRPLSQIVRPYPYAVAIKGIRFMKNQNLPLITALLSWAGGITGVAVGYAYSSALGTEPAWIGPAILVAGVGAIVVGALLIPAALRSFRGQGSP